MRKDVKILVISISFGLAFWVVDSYIFHFIFTANAISLSPAQQTFFHDIYMKLFVFIGFVLFGTTISKMAYKCHCAEDELLSQLKFENIVAEISSYFIGKKSIHIDDGINLSLKKIAEFANADRAYLVLFSGRRNENDIIYQWHRENPEIEDVNSYPDKNYPWWMQKMRSTEIVHISDVSTLPKTAEKEKKLFEKAGVVSVLSIPLQSKWRLIGFLGFDSFSPKKSWPSNYLKLMRIVGDIFVDIIERKKAEESVLKHRERLSRAQEISHTGSWEIDLRTKKHYWSEEMYRILGFIPYEISINRDTYSNLIHPADRQLFYSCLEKALNIPGYKFDIKTKAIKKNGSICILHSLGEVTWDNKGNPALFQGTTQDITDLSLAEEDLQMKNRNLLILQSTALIAASSLEMEEFLGDILSEINSYVGCNISSVYLFSSKENKYLLCSSNGIETEYLYDLGSIDQEDPLFREIPDKKSTWITENVREIHGSLEKFISGEKIKKLVFVPVISREKVIGIIFLFPDSETVISDTDIDILRNVGHQVGITVENIRLLEETRKAYEGLKSLDRMKDEFVANITHELKTPLISIKGYSELIYDGMLGDLDEKQRHCMKIIVSNSERLERLIESLLNMNSIYFEKENTFSPVYMKDILDNAANSLSMKAEDKNATILKEYSEGSHLAFGSGELLKNLFVYLLDNAIKFSEKGSEISVSMNDSPDHILVSITDSGVGIPEQCMGKIFDRFYQVDGSATRIYGGNGLGLYLAKNIVDLHCGSIEVESEEGKGTVVHVSIPAYTADIQLN